MSSCLRGVAAEALQRHVTLDSEVDPAAVARFAPDKVERVLLNLLVNALRHTPPGGEVKVTTGVRGAQATLTVADTGEGIPSADLARVFERFYRVDRARSRDTGGTGLGLAIVRHVVENHGGDVSVDSQLGAGTTFTVHLPTVPASPTEPR